MERRPTKWLRLAQQSAVLMGVGALSAGAAQAMLKTQADDGAIRRTDAPVSLQLRDGRVYLTEYGRAPQELVLGDKEGEALKHLLQAKSASGPVDVTPMIVADGAGGVQWLRPKRDSPNAGATGTEKASTTNKANPSNKTGLTGGKKTE